MPTAFPALNSPFGLRRILIADVRQRLRGDLKLEREFRSGHIQHIYELPWAALLPADRTTLDAFLVTCRGRIQADIEFEDPRDSETITCRLDQDSLEASAPSAQYWTGSLRLIEIADFVYNWLLKMSLTPHTASSQLST